MSPFGRMRVFTFAQSMSYKRFTASLICFLFARASTMKTRVLLFSVFANAVSFASGCFKIYVIGEQIQRAIGQSLARCARRAPEARP